MNLKTNVIYSVFYFDHEQGLRFCQREWDFYGEIVDSATAARLIGIHPKTLQKWRKTGKIQFKRLKNGCIYLKYDVESLKIKYHEQIKNNQVKKQREPTNQECAGSIKMEADHG